MADAPEMVKATIRLPNSLWKKTRIQAIEEGRDAQDIIRDALNLYFNQRDPKGIPRPAGPR